MMNWWARVVNFSTAIVRRRASQKTPSTYQFVKTREYSPNKLFTLMTCERLCCLETYIAVTNEWERHLPPWTVSSEHSIGGNVWWCAMRSCINHALVLFNISIETVARAFAIVPICAKSVFICSCGERRDELCAEIDTQNMYGYCLLALWSMHERNIHLRTTGHMATQT